MHGEEVIMQACAFKGCHQVTNTPLADGWRHLSDWGPAVKDGFYRPDHAKALEGVLRVTVRKNLSRARQLKQQHDSTP